MKWMSRIALAALITPLAACSSTTVQSDFDPNYSFSGLSTYTWAQRTTQGQDPAVYNDIVEARVKEAVNQALQAKGYREVSASDSPTFLVAWHGAINTKQNINTVGTSYGYGWGWYGGWGGPGISTSTTYVTEWKQGTLIVDIVDPKGNKLVWRGSAQGEVDEHRNDPQKMQKNLNEAVTKMMANFPPPPGGSSSS